MPRDILKSVGEQHCTLCVHLGFDILLTVEVPVFVVVSLERVGFVLAEPCRHNLAVYYGDAADRSAVEIAHLRHVTGVKEKLRVAGG